MLLFVTFYNTNYPIDIKRSDKKLVVEICEEVLQIEHRRSGRILEPCCSYGIFLCGEEIDQYELITESGIQPDMHVEMFKVERDTYYENWNIDYCNYCNIYAETNIGFCRECGANYVPTTTPEDIERFRMLDLFHIDEVREHKLKYDAVERRRSRRQKVLDSCEDWIIAHKSVEKTGILQETWNSFQVLERLRSIASYLSFYFLSASI